MQYICIYAHTNNCVVCIYADQQCIELAPSIEGSEVTNCTSGVPGVGYQGDTCIIVYNNTVGQVNQLRSCQENREWTITSGT